MDKEIREKQKTLQDLQDSIKSIQDIRVERERAEGEYIKFDGKGRNYVGLKGLKYLDYLG